MMFDDEGISFNPFLIGPPESAKRHEYKQPTYVTYPPYATWSKEHTNTSVSKGTILAKEDEERLRKLKRDGIYAPSKSQIGEVGYSKAIKEEMAAAKRLSPSDPRINAGKASKSGLSEAGSTATVGSGAVRTLMAVNPHRSASQASHVPSQMSTAKSTASRAKAGHRQSSQLSMRSHVTDSNVTLKEAKQPIHTDVDTDLYNDNVSRASRKSRAREYSGDNTSRRSVRSLHDANRSDEVSYISQGSARSKASVKQSDVLSRTSVVRPRADKDTNSRVSMRSKTTEIQKENLSRISHTGDENKTDNAPIKSESNILYKRRPSLKAVAESIQRELAKSMETTKSLSIKAAELSERLKAGNEFNHNRFHTLVRQYTQTEPMKRCREDRMALWFKDAVLS
ncbi:hypothetical protein ACLKA6_009572 [Drosophila palustris]